MGMLCNSVDKYVTGRMKETSNDRGWSHLLAEIWSHDAGELPAQLPRETEIAVLLRGRSLVDRAGAGMRQRTQGRRGTVWLCPAGIREDFINIEKPIDECLHIFLPGKPFDAAILENFDIDPSRLSIRYESIDQDIFISYVAEQILNELQQETSTGRLLIESLGHALSAHLVHSYSATSVRSSHQDIALKPLDEKRLSRVAEYIRSHIEQDFSVEDLSRVACMSTAHFSRSFKAATGKAPHEYVSAERLDLARRLLLTSDRLLSDIAYSTGFSSQANFNRAFRRAMGTPPGAYRDNRGRHDGA